MADDRVFCTERRLPFAARELYRAFASAPMLATWWGPDGFTNTFETFDFSVGGRWVFTMHGPDGQSYPNQCRFIALQPDERLEIRHDCAPYFTLVVELAAVDGATRLTWTQTFDDAETARAVRAIVEPANEQNLDRLTRLLHGQAGARAPISNGA